MRGTAFTQRSFPLPPEKTGKQVFELGFFPFPLVSLPENECQWMSLGYHIHVSLFVLWIPFQHSTNGMTPTCSTLFYKQARNAQQPVHRAAFMRTCSYTERFVHREAFTHRCLYTQRLSRKETFTHRSAPEVPSSTEPALLLFEVLSVFLLPLPDHQPFVFPFPSFYYVKDGMTKIDRSHVANPHPPPRFHPLHPTWFLQAAGRTAQIQG